MSVSITAADGLPSTLTSSSDRQRYGVSSSDLNEWVHTDAVYNALISACAEMEDRLQESLELYNQHPDVQANLQQLQYDLQSWNLALTTMTNMQKNMADALSSIASNLR